MIQAREVSIGKNMEEERQQNQAGGGVSRDQNGDKIHLVTRECKEWLGVRTEVRKLEVEIMLSCLSAFLPSFFTILFTYLFERERERQSVRCKLGKMQREGIFN